METREFEGYARDRLRVANLLKLLLMPSFAVKYFCPWVHEDIRASFFVACSLYFRSSQLGTLIHGPRAPIRLSRLCRAGHWVHRHGKAILPWKEPPESFTWALVDGRRNLPCTSASDVAHEASDICTYETSALQASFVPDFDSLNQGERHSRWMGLLIATRHPPFVILGSLVLQEPQNSELFSESELYNTLVVDMFQVGHVSDKKLTRIGSDYCFQ